MSKKKLLIFHPTIAPYRIDFFNSLFEAFDTRICLFYPDEYTFNYDAIYSQLTFTPVFLKRIIKIGDSFFNKGYWKHINNFNPDIVFVSELGIGTLEVLLHRFLKHKRYKIVSICDDSYNMLAENNDFSKVHMLARKLFTPLLDDVIVVEPQTRDWYQKKYGKGSFFPIIRRDDKQREVYKRTLPLSQKLMQDHQLQEKNVFLFVGRFVALKNINCIIEAFSKLNQENNALILVGNGEEEDCLRKCAEKVNVRPIFTGRLEGDDLYAWYNVADYFILASYQEAFGAVTNEALLAGCYSLISNKAGSRCLIENGVNGFTFDPLDVDELHQRMAELTKIYPKVRPLKGVKRNLMQIDYDESLRKLIYHLNKL